MKKIIYFLCVCLFSSSMFLSVSANESSNERNFDDNAIIEFMNMQDKITASMSISNGHYIYDYAKIKSIIYNFDFTDVNNILDTDYTKENFLEIAIEDIKNTVFQETDFSNSICPMSAGMCNESWTSEGWNYNRAALNDDETTSAISDCKNWASIVGAGGTISSGATLAVPALSLIMLAAGTLGATYYSMMANNLTSKQIQARGCGVVLDVNKYTFVYSIWTQQEF